MLIGIEQRQKSERSIIRDRRAASLDRIFEVIPFSFARMYGKRMKKTGDDPRVIKK